MKTYEYRLRPKHRPKTFGAVVEEFKESPEWTRFAPSTKASFEAAFNRLQDFDAVPIEDIRRRHVLQSRDLDAVRGNATANATAMVFRRLLSFAVDREYREHNPALGIKSLPTGERHRWSPKAIQTALERLPERIARAVVLALYTGQRSGDVVRMTWADYDGSGIAVRQQKTGAKVWIPAHRDLKAKLDSWERSAVTILIDGRGKPWGAHSFTVCACRAIRATPELTGLTFHGLRKTAAALLAESGCTAHEIASITGHRSLAMVEHYTREADQRVRASAAILKLENARGKTRKIDD